MLDALIDIFIKGGFVLIPIFLAAVFAWWLAFDRFAVLKLNPSLEPKCFQRILKEFINGDADALEKHLRTCPGILSKIVRSAFTHRQQNETHIRMKVDEIIMEELPKISARYDTIGVLGAVIPLLGLLGTVTGMIHTFDMITLFGSGNPIFMAGGISEALLTTQSGLVVTFPLLLILNILQNRKNRLVNDIELCVTAILNVLRKENANGNHV
jgi:biopolymer transport protein ExbB